MKLPKPYLLGVVNGINAIEAYCPSSLEELLKDPKSQDAILMRLQDIGENISKVRDGFPDFWDQNATEAWVKAIGLRNIISHGYTDISFAIIWDLITEDFKTFRESIEKLL